MKGLSKPRRSAGAARKPRIGQRRWLTTGLGRQLDDIYFQMDHQLTRMAEIQLQFDQLRSKIKHL